MLILLDGLPLARQVDATSLTLVLGLHDVAWGELLWLLAILAKVLIVVWQHVGLRKEVVIVRQYPFHLHQVPSEHVFARQVIHAREVIGALIEVHVF